MLGTITPKIQCEASSEDYGRFVVEPLESGFGLTMGNALRRVLLSSLPGASVTAVKIEGVQHEFSQIPHVKEDATEFLLNVKGIRIRPLSQRQGKMFLEVTGEGPVGAGDIKPSADFEIVNPEHHLATLDSSQASLKVEFYVDQGKGYVPAGRSDGLPIGVIPVDSIFTPIRKVNYSVEKVRVEQISNCDRLILEVWTDGTITPIQAVDQSAQMLMEHFSPFRNLEKALQEPTEKKALLNISQEQYNMPLDQLGLPARTLNCLRRGNITKVGEVLEKTDEELLALKNFGEKSLRELKEQLAALGLLPGAEAEKGAEAQAEEQPSPAESTPEAETQNQNTETSPDITEHRDAT